MDLFAPTYVPHQSGLSQPSMSPCRLFGVQGVPIRFGPLRPLRTPALQSVAPAAAVPLAPRSAPVIAHAPSAAVRGNYDRRGVRAA